MEDKALSTKLYDIVSKIPSGRLFRLTYITELPIKSELKNKGCLIEKVNRITVRTGINYNNIQEVKNLRAMGELSYDTNYHTTKMWKVSKRIFFNPNTNKEYLAVSPIRKGSNSDCYYQVTFPEGHMALCLNLGGFEEWVIPSYFRNSPTGGNILHINTDNIISINGEYVDE